MKSIPVKFVMVLTVISGVLLRFDVLFRSRPVSLDGDEAVFALMAKHIMELKEFPIYFWLAHYGGAIGAYLAALYFAVFGVSAGPFMLAGITFSLASSFLVYALGSKIFGREAGLISAALIFVPAYYVLALSRLMAGVYAEGMAFTAALLLAGAWFVETESPSNRRIFLFGVLLGAGLWTSPFIVPVFMAMAVVLALKRPGNLSGAGYILLGAGILLGYTPAIIYNIQYPGAVLLRMAGRIFDMDRSVLSLPADELFLMTLSKIMSRAAAVPAMILNIPRLMLPLIGIEPRFMSGMAFMKAAGAVALLVYAAAAVHALKPLKISWEKIRQKRPGPRELLIVYILCYVVFYSFFVEPDKSRYLLPLMIPVILFTAAFIAELAGKYDRWFLLLLPVVLGYNFCTFVMSAGGRGRDYGQLAAFLGKKKIFHGYSDYWTAYPVIFGAREKVIISPTAFTAAYDRRPEYTREVREAESAAYIFDTLAHKDVERIFQAKAAELGIIYKKSEIDGFAVYELRNIFPEVLGLERKSPVGAGPVLSISGAFRKK